WLLASAAWIMGWAIYLMLSVVAQALTSPEDFLAIPIVFFGPPIALLLCALAATSPSADQVRIDDQPDNRQGARPNRAALAARPRRRGDRVRRREFIALIGGAAMWPVAARAQQGERMRRIGMLQALADDDPEAVARRAEFEKALQALDWTVDR